MLSINLLKIVMIFPISSRGIKTTKRLHNHSRLSVLFFINSYSFTGRMKKRHFDLKEAGEENAIEGIKFIPGSVF